LFYRRSFQVLKFPGFWLKNLPEDEEWAFVIFLDLAWTGTSGGSSSSSSFELWAETQRTGLRDDERDRDERDGDVMAAKRTMSFEKLFLKQKISFNRFTLMINS
jgi:hypothetical protein